MSFDGKNNCMFIVPRKLWSGDPFVYMKSGASPNTNTPLQCKSAYVPNMNCFVIWSRIDLIFKYLDVHWDIQILVIANTILLERSFEFWSYHHTVDRIVVSFENLLTHSSGYLPDSHLTVIASCKYCVKIFLLMRTLWVSVLHNCTAACSLDWTSCHSCTTTHQ